MSILSIQSHVSYGHAGNSSAVFPLQALGFEVCPVHTVQFSNHTGYQKWSGEVFSNQHIEDVVEGVFERLGRDNCKAILTGYIGNSLIGDSIAKIIKETKASNPELQYFCDPVMGDVGRGFFVREGIPELFKNKIISQAQHISPNHFELEYIYGKKIKNLKDVQDYSIQLFDKGVESILVTSFLGESTPSDKIDVLLVERNSIFRVRTPKLVPGYEFTPVGTGDLISSLFLGYYLHFQDKKLATQMAVSNTFQVIESTLNHKRRELDIVGSRQVFNPEVSALFTGENL